MTRFCVEDILIEELKEQGLNIDDLLQIHAKKQKTETIVEITYEIGDELVENLTEMGIDPVKEIIDALQKYADEQGEGFKFVRKKEQC